MVSYESDTNTYHTLLPGYVMSCHVMLCHVVTQERASKANNTTRFDSYTARSGNTVTTPPSCCHTTHDPSIILHVQLPSQSQSSSRQSSWFLLYLLFSYRHFLFSHSLLQSQQCSNISSVIAHTYTYITCHGTLLVRYRQSLTPINGSMTFGMSVCLSVYQSLTRIRASSFFFLRGKVLWDYYDDSTYSTQEGKRQHNNSIVTSLFTDVCVSISALHHRTHVAHRKGTPHLGLSHASDLPTNPYCSGTWILCCYS